MESGAGDISWHNHPLQSIAAVNVKKRFKFETSPQP